VHLANLGAFTAASSTQRRVSTAERFEKKSPDDLAGLSSKSGFLAGFFAGLLGLLPRVRAGLLARILAGLLALLARFVTLSALLRLALVVLVHVNL
jgi:hypothetical protein